MSDFHQEKKSEPTGALFTEVINRLSALVRSEFNFARAEIDENLRRALAAIGLLVASVVFALTALNVLAAALLAALVELGVEAGWAALIVGAAFGLLAWATLSMGMKGLKLSSLAPTRTVENIKRDFRVAEGVTHAK